MNFCLKSLLTSFISLWSGGLFTRSFWRKCLGFRLSSLLEWFTSIREALDLVFSTREVKGKEDASSSRASTWNDGLWKGGWFPCVGLQACATAPDQFRVSFLLRFHYLFAYCGGWIQDPVSPRQELVLSDSTGLTSSPRGFLEMCCLIAKNCRYWFLFNNKHYIISFLVNLFSFILSWPMFMPHYVVCLGQGPLRLRGACIL